jgi:hypothetical protein
MQVLTIGLYPFCQDLAGEKNVPNSHRLRREDSHQRQTSVSQALARRNLFTSEVLELFESHGSPPFYRHTLPENHFRRYLNLKVVLVKFALDVPLVEVKMSSSFLYIKDELAVRTFVDLPAIMVKTKNFVAKALDDLLDGAIFFPLFNSLAIMPDMSLAYATSLYDDVCDLLGKVTVLQRSVVAISIKLYSEGRYSLTLEDVEQDFFVAITDLCQSNGLLLFCFCHSRLLSLNVYATAE